MATLKISDLSVGDWVGERCGTKINAVKVEEIRFNYIIHKYVAILNNKVYGLPATELHPIPITPEILEANGFEEDCGVWYNSEVRMEFEQDKDGWYRTVNCGEYSVYSIKCVHQLQHALRLAGVEKEIVMPKK